MVHAQQGHVLRHCTTSMICFVAEISLAACSHAVHVTCHIQVQHAGSSSAMNHSTMNLPYERRRYDPDAQRWDNRRSHLSHRQCWRHKHDLAILQSSAVYGGNWFFQLPLFGCQTSATPLENPGDTSAFPLRTHCQLLLPKHMPALAIACPGRQFPRRNTPIVDAMAACPTTPRHPTSIHHTPPNPYPDSCISPGQSPFLTAPVPHQVLGHGIGRHRRQRRILTAGSYGGHRQNGFPISSQIVRSVKRFLEGFYVQYFDHNTTSLGAFCPTLVPEDARHRNITEAHRFTWTVYGHPSRLERSPTTWPTYHTFAAHFNRLSCAMP